jgi:hypothetical protein
MIQYKKMKEVNFMDDRMCNIELNNEFRLLWEQHVYWTRIVIMGIAFNLPDLDCSSSRLLRNAPDFAEVFCRYYGRKNANEFGGLIRDHLIIAANLVNAAKIGNIEEASRQECKWYENADDIVCFLNHINPYWSVKKMKAMWYEHLGLTKDEAAAILTNRYCDSVEIFDQIEQEALMMADCFTEGILQQKYN